MFRISCLVVLCLLAVKAYDTENYEKVFITVYYESQCSDSKNFIIDQLLPTLRTFHPYVDLRLIPFGKAHNENRSSFVCQHGPTECLGNMVQTCALDLMQDRSDIERAEYVACEMSTEYGTKFDLQCVYDAGVDEEAVYQCATTDKGVNLQLDDEYYTKSVNPTFIPTVTFDEVFDQEIQDLSMKDLPGALCAYRKDLRPCAEYYNKMAMTYVLI